MAGAVRQTRQMMAKQRKKSHVEDRAPRHCCPQRGKRSDDEPVEEGEERISMFAFDKLLTKRMTEKGIPYETTTESIESGELYSSKKAYGKNYKERSLNGWLEEKRERDWVRACGGDNDYDDWA